MKGYKQILVQADYTLAGRTVYERTVKEAITEEIEPDTISAFMYDKYCESAVNTSEAFSNCPEDIPWEDGKLAEVTKWTEWLRDHYPH